MTRSPLYFIKRQRNGAREQPQTFGKVAVRSFNKKMIVVVHEAVRTAGPVAALVDASRVLRKLMRFDQLEASLP
jgi:hypothetical protein